MHKLWLFPAIVGGLWLYVFIGSLVMRRHMEEHAGLCDWINLLIAIIFWPVAPIIEYFEFAKRR